MKKKLLIVPACALCGAFAMASAQAQVTYVASGAVTELIGDLGLLPFQVRLGDDLSATFTLRQPGHPAIRSTPPTFPGSPTTHWGALEQMSFTIAGHTIHLSNPDTDRYVGVLNDGTPGLPALDAYQVVATELGSNQSPARTGIVRLMEDTDASLLGSSAYQLFPSNDADFDRRILEFSLWLNEHSTVSVIGTFSSVTVVPLPAALWLLVSGFGLIGVVANKRLRRL